MHRFKWIMIGMLLLLSLIFAIQNAELVEVDLLFWSVIVSKAFLILVLLLLGTLLGWLLAFGGSRHKQRDELPSNQQRPPL